MTRYCCLFVLILLAPMVKAQDGRINMTGVVVDADSKQPLTGAHLVLNETLGTTPDIEGNFNIRIAKGDTLIITHVGYNDYLVPIPLNLTSNTYFLRIGLIPTTVELKEITVYQWPATLAQFKQEILALDLEQPERVYIPGSYVGPPMPVKAGAGSPVSFLYNKLSKRARHRREFLKKRQDIETHRHARARWNVDYVKEVTGIEDEQVLKTFMEFCRFSDQKLGELNEYDLLVAINNCYDDFKSK